MNLIKHDPSELRLHATHKAHLPGPDLESPEWQSFLDGLIAAGPDGIPPLFITPAGEIMDGGWRWRAAKLLRWGHLNCIERPETECAALMVESLLGAKKMTRGAAVYLALRLLPEFVESSELRRLANLRRGVKTGQNPLKVPKCSNSTSGEENPSLETLCSRWGVNRRTYFRALEVQKILDSDPQLKGRLEPELLNGEKNLWNVLSYVGGADADQGERGFKLLVSSFNNLRLGAGAWNDLTRSEREKLLAAWEKTSAEFPATMRDALVHVLEKEAA